MSTSNGGPSVMEALQTPGTSTHSESHSGDSTVQRQDYLAQSVEYFKNQDSSGGTVVSYATSGYRSGPECDIDFDDKPAYERIDLIQEKRRVVTHPTGTGKCPPPVEVRQPVPGVLDMPDYVTKKGWLSLKRCLCFFIILSLLTLCIAVIGAAIGIYTFLAVFEGGRILGTSSAIGSSNNDAISMLQLQLSESRSVIDELRSNLSVHAGKVEQLTELVTPLLSPDSEVNSTATPPTATSATQAPPTMNSSSVFDGCETAIRTQCVIHPTSEPMGSNPGFFGCDTPDTPFQRDGQHLLNIFCNVNNPSEQNPITSNLILLDTGRVLCTCSVIISQTPTTSVSCELYATYCPL